MNIERRTVNIIVNYFNLASFHSDEGACAKGKGTYFKNIRPAFFKLAFICLGDDACAIGRRNYLLKCHTFECKCLSMVRTGVPREAVGSKTEMVQ